jgi:hypothetical protein
LVSGIESRVEQLEKLPRQKMQTEQFEETSETYEWPSFQRDPVGLAKILVKKRQTRPEQIQEAEAIYQWLILQQPFAGDLIRDSAKVISDQGEAADAHQDLYMIVRTLAAAAQSGQEASKAIWQKYQHHFIGDRNRDIFFVRLRRITRRVASAWLVNIRQSGRNLALRWDPSLLPESIMPHALRLSILHPGLLENFLPQFFSRASDCLVKKSTYRRAILILNAVPWYGWSAEKHTTRLIRSGSIEPSEAGSETERIKKFIRDLRRRHKKHVTPMLVAMLVEIIKPLIRDLRSRYEKHVALIAKYTRG